MNYAQVLKDVASVCQTLRAFIRESLSRLEHLSPNQYIAALNGFLFPEFRHKWIANPIEGSGNYTLFDDVRIHLVPRETAPDSGNRSILCDSPFAAERACRTVRTSESDARLPALYRNPASKAFANALFRNTQKS